MEDSRFGRLLSVLWSPQATFESIARRPTWAVALLALILTSSALAFVVNQHTDYYEVTQYSLERSGREIPEKDLERSVEIQEKVAGFGWVIVLFVVPLMFLFITLLHWAGLKLLGGTLSFVGALAVQTHAAIPAILRSLLGIALVAPQGDLPPEQIANQSFVMSNLSFLAPADAGPVLTSALASLDFFLLWSLVLAVVGYKIVGRVSTATAATVVGVLWLLGILVRIGFAILGAGGLG